MRYKAVVLWPETMFTFHVGHVVLPKEWYINNDDQALHEALVLWRTFKYIALKSKLRCTTCHSQAQ